MVKRFVLFGKKRFTLLVITSIVPIFDLRVCVRVWEREKEKVTIRSQFAKLKRCSICFSIVSSAKVKHRWTNYFNQGMDFGGTKQKNGTNQLKRTKKKRQSHQKCFLIIERPLFPKGRCVLEANFPHFWSNQCNITSDPINFPIELGQEN